MGYFLGVVFSIIILSLIKEYKEKKEARRSVDQCFSVERGVREESTVIDSNGQLTEEEESNFQIPDIPYLMKAALTEIGCQPEINKDGILRVSYQGEDFHMEFGGMYTRIWDPYWAVIQANDPEWPKVREAINTSNYNFGPTVVYSKPNEEGIIGVHSCRDIILHPAIPDVSGYIRSVLDSFFRTKENVKNGYHRLILDQQKSSTGNRPVGFNISAD